MAQQFLNGADVVIGLQQVGGEGVAEGVGFDPLGNFRFCNRLIQRTPKSLSLQRFSSRGEGQTVVAGMVKSPWEYQWSSTRFQCGLIGHDPLVKDRTLQGLVTDWQEFLCSKTEAELELLRQATRTGRPAGDQEFVEKVGALTGRELKIKRAGRPSRRE